MFRSLSGFLGLDPFHQFFCGMIVCRVLCAFKEKLTAIAAKSLFAVSVVGVYPFSNS